MIERGPATTNRSRSQQDRPYPAPHGAFALLVKRCAELLEAKGLSPLNAPSQQDPILPCPGLMPSSMVMVGLEPECLTNPVYVPHLDNASRPFFQSTGADRESFFETPALRLPTSTMRRRHHPPYSQQPRPPRQVGLIGAPEYSKERPDTSVSRTKNASYGSHDGNHPGSAQATRGLAAFRVLLRQRVRTPR